MVDQETLKIAHYNILKGGGGRLPIIGNIIKEIDPDICGILEAVGWEDNEQYFKVFFTNLGYNFFHLGRANSKYNIAVISKFPIKTTSIRDNIRHVIVEATIESGPFKDFNIFFTHLSPASEDDRLQELDHLLKLFSKKSHTVIMGDLNALAPYDSYNKEELFSILKRENIEKYGSNALRFETIQKIQDGSLIDTFKYLHDEFDYTTPTQFNTDPTHAANIRIDYGFITPPCLDILKTSEIFKSKETEEASDHYPYSIELSYKK